jgi:hypothetical protein
MAKKTPNVDQQVPSAVPEPVVTTVMDANKQDVRPEETAQVGTGAATNEVDQNAGAKAEIAEPAKTKSAAVRMMTKSIAVKKSSTAKSKSQRVADAAKPSQKPAPGGSGRARRRGASKGR